MAGPPKLYPDKIVAPLVAGKKIRIVSLLRPQETITEFLRAATDAEIKRREREYAIWEKQNAIWLDMPSNLD